MLVDLFTVLGVVFLAEVGDKSNLLALALAARHRAVVVLAGIAAAAATMLGVAVLVGSVAGTALPDRPLRIVAGLLFVGFGLWVLRDDHDGAEDTDVTSDGGGFAATFLAFLAAEFGDKTMLATVTLATTRGAVPTWIGATAGMTLASAIAITIGAQARARLPERAVHLGSAALFLVLGAILLVDGLRG